MTTTITARSYIFVFLYCVAKMKSYIYRNNVIENITVFDNLHGR